jgi:hypothetical protein
MRHNNCRLQLLGRQEMGLQKLLRRQLMHHSNCSLQLLGLQKLLRRPESSLSSLH